MLRILVIDDDLLMLRMMTRMLSSHDCEVTTANTGPEGIDYFNQSDFDIVITDVAIPVSQGLETIRVARALKPSLPILATSGGGWLVNSTDLLDIAREAGATATIEKPFTAADLWNAVRACVVPSAPSRVNSADDALI